VCDGLERDKGPYAWAGQYMQSPAPRGGAIIRDEFWQLWERDTYPAFEFVVASLDTAFTEKEENDPSALTIWGVFREEVIQPILPDGKAKMWLENQAAASNPKIMLIYAWEERLRFDQLVEMVTDTCIRPSLTGRPNYPVDKLLIEAKGNGISVAHELHRLWRGSGKLGIDLIDPKKYGDKVARVTSIQHLFADGMIYAPDKTWADKVIRQCSVFPKGSHDDLVDSMSQAIRYLRDQGFALNREESALEAADETSYDRARALRPLYQV